MVQVKLVAAQHGARLIRVAHPQNPLVAVEKNKKKKKIEEKEEEEGEED